MASTPARQSSRREAPGPAALARKAGILWRGDVCVYVRACAYAGPWRSMAGLAFRRYLRSVGLHIQPCGWIFLGHSSASGCDQSCTSRLGMGGACHIIPQLLFLRGRRPAHTACRQSNLAILLLSFMILRGERHRRQLLHTKFLFKPPHAHCIRLSETLREDLPSLVHPY